MIKWKKFKVTKLPAQKSPSRFAGMEASKVAENIISKWNSEKKNFVKIMPIEYKAALEKLKEEKINQLIN